MERVVVVVQFNTRSTSFPMFAFAGSVLYMGIARGRLEKLESPGAKFIPGHIPALTTRNPRLSQCGLSVSVNLFCTRLRDDMPSGPMQLRISVSSHLLLAGLSESVTLRLQQGGRGNFVVQRASYLGWEGATYIKTRPRAPVRSLERTRLR